MTDRALEITRVKAAKQREGPELVIFTLTKPMTVDDIIRELGAYSLHPVSAEVLERLVRNSGAQEGPTIATVVQPDGSKADLIGPR